MKVHIGSRIRSSFNAVTIPLLVLMLTGMLSVVYISYQNSDKLIEQQITQEYTSILENKQDTLESTISHMLSLVFSVTSKDEAYDVVTGRVTAYNKAKWINEARGMLYFNINAYEGFNVLFYADTGFYFFKGDAAIKYTIQFKNSAWYTDAIADKSQVHWFGLRQSESNYQGKQFFGSYRLELRSKNYGDKPVIVTAFFSLDQTQMDKLMQCQNGTIYLVNRDGRILYDTTDRHTGGRISDLGIPLSDLKMGREYLVEEISDVSRATGNNVAIISPVDEYGLSVVHIREHNSILSRFKALQLFFYVFFLAVIVFIAYYIYLYFRIIQKPLKRIFGRITVSNQNLSYPVTTGLKRLDDEFNRIMMENKMNLRKINEFERNLWLAEIKKLQAEIDPHFLYNVLSHIRFAAIMENPKQIRQIMDALFVILDSKRRMSGHLITVQREIEILYKYIEIMQIVYKDNIEFAVRVDPSIVDCRIPSFILQPIVENCIHHGINPAEKGGIIRITGSLEDEAVCFVVEDNGCGIREDAIENVLQNGTDRNEHMGIINIDRKIKLCCGDEYGISIESRFDHGARVTLRVARVAPDDSAVFY